MSIPNGYRLLNENDIGKVFGVDLESIVYFDEDVTPTFYLTSIGELNLTNFCEERRDYLPIAEEEISSGIYLNGSGYIYYEVGGVSFSPTEADLSGIEITSFNTDYSWNNWFYVKDIEIEKVIITKSKITNLADKVRAKVGTSINYTIDAMAAAVENLQLGVDENSIYSGLNEMKFGNTKFTITVKGVTGYYACSYMKYYLNGDSTTTYTVGTDTVTHNDVESITFYGTKSGDTWSSAYAAYITINGEDAGTDADITASYSETFTITEDSDIIVTTSSLD